MAKIWTNTSNNNVSFAPVEVGKMRYVGRTNDQGTCVAHVVVALAGTKAIFNPETREMDTIYLYVSRLATDAEEAAYLALPRQDCFAWRAAA